MNDREEYKNKYNQEKRNGVFKNLIIILLIIVIILLLLHSCHQKNENEYKPDVFEINCDCDKKDNDDNDNTFPTINEDGSVVVTDEYFTWKKTNKLKIFENKSFQNKEIVAPGSTGKYNFSIKNNKSCNIVYKIDFSEQNKDYINMKYKLKRNDIYLNTSWVSYKELNIKNYLLKGNSQDSYVLEWKWVESDNDTKAGKIGAKYTLSLNIYGEQIS